MRLSIQNVFIGFFFLITVHGLANESNACNLHKKHGVIFTKEFSPTLINAQSSPIELLDYLSDLLTITHHPSDNDQKEGVRTGEDRDSFSANLTSSSSHIVFGGRLFSILHYYTPDIDAEYLRLFRPVLYDYCSDFLYAIRKLQI